MKKFRPLFWVLVAIVVVAAAVAVVCLALFGEKDAKALTLSISPYTTTGYLSDTENGEYQKIMTYLNKLDTTLTSQEDKKELDNFKDGYTAYLNVATFFQRESSFMQATRTYRKYKRTIKNKLASAQKEAKEFVAQIEKNEKITADSEFWQRIAWTDCKELMRSLLSKTIDAYNVFAEVYTDSVKSNLLNNDYSDIMFAALKDLSAIVKEEYRSEENCGNALKTFTSIYFTKNGESQILKYSYTDNDSGSTVRTTVLDIKAKGKASSAYASFITTLLSEGGV